jgi:hypothetical protein
MRSLIELSRSKKIDERKASQGVAEDWAEVLCARYPQIHDFTEDAEPGGVVQGDAIDRRPSLQLPQTPAVFSHPFSGGEMVFFPDGVDLCGVTICVGPRCEQHRKALDVLRRQRQQDGQFRGIGSKKLAENMQRARGANSVPGLIRDLRNRITKELRRINIECGRRDVVTRTPQGYQFREWITVRDETEVSGQDDQRHAAQSAAESVPDLDGTNVPNARDPNDPNVTQGKMETRRYWILEQLRSGRELRAPDMARALGCSLRTVKRDLEFLKREGLVEFVGEPRTGHYRVKKGTKRR